MNNKELEKRLNAQGKSLEEISKVGTEGAELIRPATIQKGLFRTDYFKYSE
jgi:hypothetical protein